MTISSWLNFGRPAPPWKGVYGGAKFLAPPYYSQRAVFASPLSAFSLFPILYVFVSSLCEWLVRQTRSGAIAAQIPLYLYISKLQVAYLQYWSIVRQHWRLTQVTGQLADKPTRRQFNSPTNQIAEIDILTFRLWEQGLIFRAYRHGRAWRSEIRAWKFGNPCLKFWQWFIIAATIEPLWIM